ncbi:MAG TPA: MlaD family protein [Thermoanaerobaculia bacterium]
MSERGGRRRGGPPPAAETAEGEVARARVHPVEWTPWVWVLLVVALVLVGWLVVRYVFFGGGDVTVRFAEARGLDRYSPVRYRGAKVGTVQEIEVDEALDQVEVRIAMDARMSDALRANTRFWIVEPSLEGGIGNLIAGTYVAIAPGDGDRTRRFQGLEHPPIVAAPGPGRIFVIEAPEAGEAAIGTPVSFRGMTVGRVLGAEYDHRRGVSAIHLFVLEPYAVYVRESTRFWRTGGLSVSLGGGGLSLGGASLPSLLSPSFAFYTPEVLAGPVAPEGSRFELHPSQAAAVAASGGPRLEYVTYFPGPVRGLGAGTPVRMKGVEVGSVRSVSLRYVAPTGGLETPAVLVVDPRRMGIEVAPTSTRDELRQTMDEVLDRLVQNGLRARLATSLVLPGASAVDLDLIGTAGTARLDRSSEPPVIPASGAGDGLGGALASLERVAATIEDLPLRQIAGDLRSAARRVDALVHDPRLESSLGRLDAALADVEGAAAITRENVEPIAHSLRNAARDIEAAAATIQSAAGTAGENVEPIVESLRNAAAAAETAAARAGQLLGDAPRQNYDLGELMRELTRAAEAVRALATYLTENPESLLRGRDE